MSTVDTAQPIHKSAQRLRWFMSAFETQVETTSLETGNEFAVDKVALAEVFTEWLKAFEAQKPKRQEDKAAYVGFAAGLMLRALLRRKPVAVTTKPAAADESNPAYFWPEGYLYVAFCLNIRGLVLENDFAAEQNTNPILNETRTWWSFRENVSEDASLAIAFLDLFAGDEPEWTMPDLFRTGRAHEIGNRFYAKVVKPSDE
ncbi:hypothetical protein OAH97_01465 [Octadecabacter sp.]|nr:hypothetical protein [Octadecabacter sp.]